jgi:hypothetical protein
MNFSIDNEERDCYHFNSIKLSFNSNIRSISIEIASRATETNQFRLILRSATLSRLHCFCLYTTAIEFWYCTSFVALLNLPSHPLEREQSSDVTADNHLIVACSVFKNSSTEGMRKTGILQCIILTRPIAFLKVSYNVISQKPNNNFFKVEKFGSLF